MVVVNCWDRYCTFGRAPRTKETLPDFREWCLVTRHPRVFRKLTGCQRTPGKWGVTIKVVILVLTLFLEAIFVNDCKTRENSNFLKNVKQ